MHERIGRYRLFLTAALTLALFTGHLVSASPARARHSEKLRITKDTAYNLPAGEIRVGMWEVYYGIIDELMVSTVHFPNLIRLYNANLKWRIWQSDPWAVSASLGVWRLDFQQPPFNLETPLVLTLVPFETVGSYRFNHTWTLSSGFIFTNVSAQGSDGDASEDALNGAAAVDNAQYTLTLEWRWSEVTALVFSYRHLLYQGVTGKVDAEMNVDEYTTVKFVAGLDSDVAEFGGASSVVSSFVWSWDSFNLRVGLGWGNWSIPGINFVIPEAIPCPDLDMYWIF